MIISELKGGENDPEQLLDIELTAAAFRAASRTSTRPSAGCRDLETMTRDDLYGHYRRFYVPNNATLVIVGDVDTDEALARVEHHFGSIPGGGDIRRDAAVGAAAAGRAPRALPQGRHDGLLARRVPRAGVLGPRLLPDAVSRCGADRRVGPQHLVGPQGADAAAQRAALSRARRRWPRLEHRRRAAADRAPVSLLHLRDGGRRSDAGPVESRGRSPSSIGLRARASPKPSWPRSAPSCERASSTTATA